jgi:hypothetical protein
LVEVIEVFNCDTFVTRLAKDAFTRLLVKAIEVFNWARLDPRLRKEALTTELLTAPI